MLEYVQQWMGALEERINLIEQKAAQMIGQLQESANTANRASEKIENQQQSAFGVYTAICVSTKDPEGACRVSYFNPHFYSKDVNVKQLRWAVPVRNSGGIDDTGWNWVPQAGSLLCIQFANGNRDMPFYFGTIWYQNKSFYNQGDAKDFLKFWDEYDQYHAGHRRGYLLGPNDDSQCFQPWSSEMYNCFDPSDNSIKVVNGPDGTPIYADLAKIQAGMTIPYIYGCSTPQKHRLKFVDGMYDAFFQWKRIELISSLGNAMLFKDDFLNPSGQWGANARKGDSANDTNHGCGFGADATTEDGSNSVCANPYFKNAQECWPIIGPGTPQNNRYMLPQTGIQFITRSGITWFGDDSVEEPQGTPSWEANFEPENDGKVTNRLKKFDFGKTDKFLGKTGWISACGEQIVLNDEESDTGIRSENNGIFIDSSVGNFLHFCNHTLGDGTAGDNRGWFAGSSSGHTLSLCDKGNEQDVPFRKGGGEPANLAKAAYVSLRSGGGLELMFNDGTSQRETADQFAYLYVPQDTNPDRPGHMLRFQAKADGPGQVLLEVGGDFLCQTYDKHETIVGREDNPSDKVVRVSGDHAVETKGIYANTAQQHRFHADEIIELFAGNDKETVDPKTGKITQDANAMCIVMWDPERGLIASDRVFGSASPDAMKVPITQMMPFTTGQGDDTGDEATDDPSPDYVDTEDAPTDEGETTPQV